MPPTTLPAPEIKIGLRLPVNCTLPRILAGKCEPVHIQQKIPFGKKVAWCRSGGDKPVAGLFALTFRWRPIGPATQQKLRKLYGLLRRLAADRGARTSDPAGKAVSVQPRTSVFDLQRAPARAMPRIHLRMADCIKSAAGMDASRQVGPDPAGGQFHLAWPAGRRGRRRRDPAQAKGAGLAEEVRFGKEAASDLSDRRGLVCLWATGVPGRDCRAHPKRRRAVGRLTG